MMVPRAPEAIGKLAVALGAGNSPADAVDAVFRLSSRAGVTRLAELGVDPIALPEVVAASLQHPALGNTPDPPGEADLSNILEAAH
jgi:alcohol dehydrogenase class IV